jgi:hypothetical protein
MSKTIIDLTNKVFGKLTVIKQHGRDKWGQVAWECRCECGKSVVVVSGNLRRKHGNISCGCGKSDQTRRRYTTHGHTSKKVSREYRTWQGMKKRCLNKSHFMYKDYGGRGIKICDRWLNSFENFLSDMGERPPDFTLDRIDVNGNYEPSNCRWADWFTQSRNKRQRNRPIALLIEQSRVKMTDTIHSD